MDTVDVDNCVCSKRNHLNSMLEVNIKVKENSYVLSSLSLG